MTQGLTIKATTQGQIMALDWQAAADILALDVPTAVMPGAEFMASSGDVRIEAGERFAIYRGVAVMPIRGLLTPDNTMYEKYLGWSTYAGIVETADALMAADDVGAVIVEVNSPGGYTRALASAADALAALSAVKPVYVLVNSLAASAAYHLVSQCSDIAMIGGAEVGSIGVMVESYDPVQPDMWGDQHGIVVSDHAAAKLPKVTTDEGVGIWKLKLNALESQFHAAVAKGRNIPLDQLAARLSVTDNPADGGAVYGPADAITRGLADRQVTRAAFYEDIFARHGLQAKPKASGARAMAAQAQAAAARAIATI